MEPFNVLCTTRFGRMLVNKNDVFIGESLRRYGEYSWGEVELFERLLRAGNTVVEAGANIGAHTVPLARIVGPQGTVHAFEPQRLVFQTLCANLALNQCTNAHARQAALGASATEMDLPPIDSRQRNNFGGVSLVGAAGGERVPMTTLDDLKLQRCDMLKADVEGMEAEVLKGSNETIVRFRPFIYAENDRKERSPALIELLLKMNYRLWWHAVPLFNPNNLNGESQNMFGGVVSLNMLCVPRERPSPVAGLAEVSGPQDWWFGKYNDNP